MTHPAVIGATPNYTFPPVHRNLTNLRPENGQARLSRKITMANELAVYKRGFKVFSPLVRRGELLPDRVRLSSIAAARSSADDQGDPLRRGSNENARGSPISSRAKSACRGFNM